MIGSARSTGAAGDDAVNAPDDSVYYTWTCPICGASRTSFTRGEPNLHQALNALRAHVSTSEGDGHGRRNSYPDGFDQDQLVEQVTFDEGNPD